MEFNEVDRVHFPIKIIQPFCIKSSSSGHHSVLSNTLIEVLKLKYSYLHDSSSVNFEFTEVLTNKSVPSNKITLNGANIFNKASTEEKHELLLDNRLIPKLSQSMPNINIISQEWSPLGIFPEHCLLMTLTNFGVAVINRWTNTSILYEQNDKRDWSVIFDLTENWRASSYNNKLNSCTTFESLKSETSNSIIKAICWKDKNLFEKSFIACVLESGKLVIWSIDVLTNLNEFKPNIHSVYEWENLNIVTLKWFSHPLNNSLSFLLAGSCDGRIFFYKIELNNHGNSSTCILQNVLWAEIDFLSVSLFEIEFCEETKNIFLITVKGNHLILFLLNEVSGEILETKNYYVGNICITGVTKISFLNYLICTISGNIFSIQIIISSTGFVYKINEIKINIDFSKWNLYGITSTINNCLWMFVIYPVCPFDHLVLRSPTNIVICSLNIIDPYEILKKNKELRLTNYFDSAELIRYICNKTKDIKEDFIEDIDNNIEINDKYVYRLKLKLIIYGSLAGYYRRRSDGPHHNNIQKFRNTTHIIEAINYYMDLCRLNKFYQANNNFTNIQIKSSKLLRNFLESYLRTELQNEFENVKNFLREPFQKIINETEYLNLFDNEICLYCLKHLPNDKIICEDKHNMSRCMFTLLQVPLFEQKWCPCCNRECLHNENDIKEVLLKNTIKLVCPICDYNITLK